jgi:hypothetical protein
MCGDDLTRENLLEQATSLKKVVAPLLLRGISISTRPDRYAPYTQMQIARFDGKSWVPEAKSSTPTSRRVSEPVTRQMALPRGNVHEINRSPRVCGSLRDRRRLRSACSPTPLRSIPISAAWGMSKPQRWSFKTGLKVFKDSSSWIARPQLVARQPPARDALP